LIFEEAQDAIFWADGDTGLIIRCNQAAERLLGRSRAELIGQPQSFIHPPDLLEYVQRTFREHADRQSREPIETAVLREDGTRVPVEVSPSVVSSGRHTILQGIFRDVSARKRAEAERSKLEHQIRHSQKLESLGVLAGGLAHDFNNILMAILGNADLALHEMPLVGSARQHLEEIVRSARQAADLTRQMLAYSGKGRFDVRPIDLSATANEMAHLLHASISKKAALRMHLASTLPAIKADAAQIHQVLLNLVLNASEALDPTTGGLITVRTGDEFCSTEKLAGSRLPERPPAGRFVFLEVTDTGSGMTAEVLEKLFDPFFTTKFQGRGLGLSAVLGIVRGHRGAIFVESQPGGGSTVRVLVPAAEESAMRQSTTGPGSDHRDWARPGTVLLVDDEEAVRTVGRRMLERLGYDVLVAEDGVVAVEQFRAHRGRISCVLLDLSMPRMDGAQALRELRVLAPELPVVISSGFSETQLEERFRGERLSGFIQKPYLLDALRDVLLRALS